MICSKLHQPRSLSGGAAWELRWSDPGQGHLHLMGSYVQHRAGPGARRLKQVRPEPHPSVEHGSLEHAGGIREYATALDGFLVGAL